MRLPRPRFTVRRLMVAVAIVGLVIGLSRWLWVRSVAFRRLADFHGSKAMGGIPMTHSPNRIFHSGLYEKYDHAARYPWLPVEADPPEPK